jgi:hypothetical protein
LSNATLDGTFVTEQRVIYNVGALYAGSASHAARYTSPTGVACDYKLVIPADDLFLGSDEATIVWPGLTGGDPVDATAQREQTSYWIAAALGLPFNYQRCVHFFVNGVGRSFIMQDTQKPDADLLQQWFPDDDDGELFKVQIWREYDASVNNTTTIGASLGNFTTTGGAKKTARYRWAWTPRASEGTMNDFTNLFALVDAVNSPTNTYTAAVEAAVDIEQWMRTFAVEHIVGNWDSYGYGNGQNMYAYKPAGGRWKMIMWDLDVCLGNASDLPNADLFKLTNPYVPFLNGDLAVVDRMYKHPKFARAYWRAVLDAVNGPLLSANLNAMLDAKAAAFAASGIGAASPASIKTFLRARRDYCVGRLATVAANFGVSTPAFVTTTNNPVLLSGTAPVAVRDLLVNGVLVPVTWTSVTSWTASVAVRVGTNTLILQGLDRLGNALSTARWTNTVHYTGPAGLATGVFINEWLASNVSPGGYPNPVGGDYDDWFELYNPGTDPADLTGCSLTDNLADPLRFVIPAGYTIAPRSYLLVWTDDQPSRNNPGHPDLHVNFKLSQAGDAIGLFAPDGRQMDAVSFGPQTSNVSQGRFPDGDVSLQFVLAPTPRAANVKAGVTNAPVITGIERSPNGDLALTWRTIPGKSYRVEYRNNLDDPQWIPLGDYLANGTALTIFDPIGTRQQRFYRLRELE